jgi:hypothetical protein
MKRIIIALSFALPLMEARQPAPSIDPFKGLGFLEQNWEANTNGFGGVKSVGTYTFRRELAGHILARRSTSDVACKGLLILIVGMATCCTFTKTPLGKPSKPFTSTMKAVLFTTTSPRPLPLRLNSCRKRLKVRNSASPMNSLGRL